MQFSGHKLNAHETFRRQIFVQSIYFVLGDDSLSFLPIAIVFTVIIYNIKKSSCKSEEVRGPKKSSGFLITDNRMNVQHLFTTSTTTES